MADMRRRCHRCREGHPPTVDDVLRCLPQMGEDLPTRSLERHIVVMVRLEASLWGLVGLCPACAREAAISGASSLLKTSDGTSKVPPRGAS